MPIRKELRAFYGREWRTVTRPRILARAGDRCEDCKKPNHAIVETLTARRPDGDPLMYWRLPPRLLQPANPNGKAGPWTDRHGTEHPKFSLLNRRSRRVSANKKVEREIQVVLTVAHLNHTPGDDRDDNLRAWCQWCHLIYDRQHHRETRATRKDAARPIQWPPEAIAL